MTVLGWSVHPRLLRAVQIAIALGLLGFVWSVADGPEAARTLADANVTWLAAACAALTFQTVLSALRWRVTAGQLGIDLAPRWAIREYYLAQIVNQSLPGGMVGDAARAVRAREQAGLLASGQAVIFERLAGQVGMFAVMATAFAVTLALPGGVDWPQWLVVPVAALIGAVILLPMLVWLLAKVPGTIGVKLRSFQQTAFVALLAKEVLALQIALSVATTVCNLAAFAFCAMAVGVELSLVATVTLVPLILVTMLVPISVSGWGLREGAASLLFPLAGATASDGLAASVAFGLIFLLSVLPGLVPLMLRRDMFVGRT
jgi:glycosyltransferase 2 family protein